MFLGAGEEILDRNRVARVEPGIFSVKDLVCLVEHPSVREPLQKRMGLNRLRTFSGLMLDPRWRWHNSSMVDFHECDSVRDVKVFNIIAWPGASFCDRRVSVWFLKVVPSMVPCESAPSMTVGAVRSQKGKPVRNCSVV